MNTTKITKTVDGEFRVRLFVDGEYQAGADYFGSDRIDAEGTAKLMVRDGGISDKTTDFAIDEMADFEACSEEPVYSYVEDEFSDLYKDVNGFRPRGHVFYSSSPAEKQEIWDYTLVALDRELEYQRMAEGEAVIAFETLVNTTIEAGAGDRETAIRWIVEAEQDESVEADRGYFSYLYGLPSAYNVNTGEMITYEKIICN